MDQAPGAGRLERLRRARAPSRSGAASCAACGIATFLEWTGGNVFEERVTVDGAGRRRHRDLLGDARRWGRASRPRSRSWRSTPSACRSRRSASCWATPTAATASAAPARARCSPAARRCASAPSARSTRRKTLAAQELEAAAADIEYARRRASRSPAPICGIDLFDAGRHGSPSSADLRRLDQHRRRPDLAERLPHLRGRDRSADRRGQRRRLLRRSTTSAAWSIR